MKKYLVDFDKFNAFIQNKGFEISKNNECLVLDINECFCIYVNTVDWQNLGIKNQCFINFLYEEEDNCYMDESFSVDLIVEMALEGVFVEVVEQVDLCKSCNIPQNECLNYAEIVAANGEGFVVNSCSDHYFEDPRD